MATDISSYLTLSRKVNAEFKDKGSKFFGISFPVDSKEEFEVMLGQIREELPRATHYCYAYKLGFDNNNYRINDDGEPSGSAGKPIFGQIESNKLTNTGIVVVRYYGGTKLGVPGLINAYKNAAALSIADNEIIEKIVEKKFRICFNTSQYEQLQICIGQLKKICGELKFNSELDITVTVSLDNIENLRRIIFENIYGYAWEPSNSELLENIITEIQ